MSDTASRAGHPSPHRERIDGRHLAVGLLAGPVAWFVRLLIAFSLASAACYPGFVPLRQPLGGFRYLWPTLVALDVLALALSATGALLAWRAWNAARHETEVPHHHLAEVGEGRSRFLAFWGLWTSLGFVVVILFDLVAVIVVPPCQG